MSLQRVQKNLSISPEALAELKRAAQEAGMNESQYVEMLLLRGPSYEARLYRIERTFEKLAETNQALAGIWNL